MSAARTELMVEVPEETESAVGLSCPAVGLRQDFKHITGTFAHQVYCVILHNGSIMELTQVQQHRNREKKSCKMDSVSGIKNSILPFGRK